MAYGVNKVILIGNVGKDAELRYTAGGTAVAKLSLATSEAWGKGEGKKERTEWHKIVAWGKQAEFCGNYIKKGSKIYVEGRIQTRDWEDKDGNKRYMTEIVAHTIQFIGGKDDRARGDSSYSSYDNASLDSHVDQFADNQSSQGSSWANEPDMNDFPDGGDEVPF
jgi:single-strand DNA-binding protein